mmetsp:Transcript_26194/g.37227  ORF Transcript_26194/g.37227 Transcript_26194/m.37227 type:complete len:152 (-) Transcript_26194:308-763(-)
MRSNSAAKFSHFFCPQWGCGGSCRLIALGLLSTLVQLMLLLMLIVPGVWFAVASMFAVPMLVEQSHLSVYDSIRCSVKVLRGKWCSAFCFCLLLSVMNSMWFLWLFTVPCSLIVYCYCYAHIVGVNRMPVYVSVLHPEVIPHIASHPPAAL